jgi:hypothetical protein
MYQCEKNPFPLKKTYEKICRSGVMAVAWGVPNNLQRQRKRTLSFHEKQNRFFAISLVTLTVLIFTAIIWFANRPSFKLH